jgi:hypothetical protein
MRYLLKILGAAALLGVAAPAPAAPADDAACVLEPVSASDRAAMVGQLLRDGMARPTAAETDANQRFSLRVLACAQERGWDMQRAMTVNTYASSVVVRDELRRRLATAGVDADHLDRWFEGQSEAFRTTAFLTMSDRETDRALRTLPGPQLPRRLYRRNLLVIGVYIGSRALIERTDRGLPLPDFGKGS